MQYIRKMCILRQLKQGFSGDGKTLSGLVKVEQYGKNLSVEVSIINFAPLTLGEYYCILVDEKDRTQLLSLQGKSLFNVLTDMDVSGGFCAIICMAGNEITPVAYGVNGDRTYDWKRILHATLPPSYQEHPHAQSAEHIHDTQLAVGEPTQNVAYNDERIAGENYYKENEDEHGLLQEIDENAPTESASENEDKKTGLDFAQDETVTGVLHPFTTDSDGYYQSVKSEIDELFSKYPQDDTLNGAFSCSKWVRVKGEAHAPEYLVGVTYLDGKAQYVCYALKAVDKNAPPDEIRDVCAFVPISPFQENDGFFIIFQSAATGQCIKPFSS